MEVIHVYTSPYDLDELRKRVPSFRPTGFIGSEIARNYVWERVGGIRAKIPAAAEVGRLIDQLPPSVGSEGLKQKVWISVCGEYVGARAAIVATVTVGLGVDNVAAQSHQGAVLPGQVERDRSDREALLNL